MVHNLRFIFSTHFVHKCMHVWMYVCVYVHTAEQEKNKQRPNAIVVRLHRAVGILTVVGTVCIISQLNWMGESAPYVDICFIILFLIQFNNIIYNYNIHSFITKIVNKDFLVRLLMLRSCLGYQGKLCIFITNVLHLFHRYPWLTNVLRSFHRYPWLTLDGVGG
jgi:hypothetical protein